MSPKTCPCGAGKDYQSCCQPIHQNPKKALKPEQLMRSRYSAYVLGNIDYIEKTMCSPASDDFNTEESKQWAERVEWLGLEILQSKRIPNKPQGTVTFIARYKDHAKEGAIAEKSFFIKKSGQWFYSHGKPFVP
jgi:SEC-C motif-containing protein